MKTLFAFFVILSGRRIKKDKKLEKVVCSQHGKATMSLRECHYMAFFRFLNERLHGYVWLAKNFNSYR